MLIRKILNFATSVLILIFIHGSLNAQIIVRDIFNRELNANQVTLVDWQGNLMNPMIKLSLTPPETGVSYPLSASVKAVGSSRLMMDKPSTLTANGAVKSVTFANSSSTIDIYLAIAPDRNGGYGEIESYELIFSYNGSSNIIPIKVIDLDDDLEPILPVKFDYRFDNINNIFDDTKIKDAAELAIKDWFYFFDYESFDEVPVGNENIWLPGNDWKNHVQVTNEVAYSGYYAFMRGLVSPYSTGFPSNSGKYHKQNDVLVPGPLHRSSALILHFYPDATIFTSTADDDWYLSDIRRCADVYGLVMHEFGHAITFHDWWQGFVKYKNNYAKVQDIINYQGEAVPIDNYGHIPEQEQYWDRLSGQSAGWNSKFPQRRWMLTKLTLLVAEQVGWKLREIGPFVSPEIVSDEVVTGVINKPYEMVLESNMGGVPFYDWRIIEGSLPNGLTLNRFTGEISGTIDDEVGNYSFTVQLRDYDELSDPVTKELSMNVSSCAAPTGVYLTDITLSEAIIKWNDVGAQSYNVEYKIVGGDWETTCEGITNYECKLTGLSLGSAYVVKVISTCPDGDLNTMSSFTTADSTATGINEINEFGNLELYPNPVRDFLKIKNSVPGETYEVYTINGDLLFKTDENVIDVQSLNTGVYILRGKKNYARFVKF